jgi:KaiC/GvpD/RAD55 family RecA-like ATPase
MSNKPSEKSKFPERIAIGYPLDLLLNRNCRLSDYDQWRNSREVKKDPGKKGGLVVPSTDGNGEGYSPGTGNIVIRGKPGTGKSTLALQMACAVTYKPNNAAAVYFSLEESRQNIVAKAGTFGWESQLHPMVEFCDTGDNREPTTQIVEDCLKGILTGDCGNKVLVPSMAPRSVFIPDRPVHDLFWDRYRQLELILSAAEALNEKAEREEKADKSSEFKPIRLVCVDSLSVFGDMPLTREELYKIFDLFRRYRMIGVFTAEEPDRGVNGGNQDIDYLADMVIHLHSEEDNGYAMKYIEVTKSRYQNELHGRHPFKIRIPSEETARNKKKSVFDENFAALKIYLSLHHVVLATGGLGNDDSGNKPETLSPEGFDIGVKGLEDLLPPNLQRRSVVTIKGPRGAFKTQMARSFLMSGVLKQENTQGGTLDNHVLLINLRGVPSIAPGKSQTSDRWILDRQLLDKSLGKDPPPDDEKAWIFKGPENFNLVFKKSEEKWSNGQKHKATTFGRNGKRITELTFRSGALLPEEFIEEVRQVMSRYDQKNERISRVVLDDVSLIGTSYPFLRSSKTGADLFLPTFVHVMRNYGVDLVMTASTGELQEVRDVVDRAVGLSDTVLDVQFCDVFGKQHVIILGDGLTAEGSGQSKDKELVPGTVQVNHDEAYFEVVPDILQGLVGFSTGRVHRPGLTVHVPEQGPLLEEYNKEIEHMISSTFGYSLQKENMTAVNRQGIAAVQRFSNAMAETVHDSMTIKDLPLDQTVVCAVDEFGHPFDEAGKKLSERFVQLEKDDKESVKKDNRESVKYENGFGKSVYMRPYYGNVLVIAYRSDLLGELPAEKLTWTDLVEKVVDRQRSSETPYTFYYDDASGETMACAIIDAMLRASGKKLSEIVAEIKSQSTLSAKEIFSKITAEDGASPDRKTTNKREIYALYKLMRQCADEKDAEKRRSENQTAPPSPPFSAFYLCWYSQLREWMAEDDKGLLAPNIRVLPLPGGGFRGDWFLGVVKGSVSRSLGEQVINSLCSAKEDYKRFARGVGLPTRESFYTNETGNFYAWPNGANTNSDVPTAGGYLLQDFYKSIYKGANKRSDIPDYQQVRPILWAICRQLEKRKAPSSSDKEKIWNIVKRIPEQIELLIPSR